MGSTDFDLARGGDPFGGKYSSKIDEVEGKSDGMVGSGFVPRGDGDGAIDSSKCVRGISSLGGDGVVCPCRTFGVRRPVGVTILTDAGEKGEGIG